MIGNMSFLDWAIMAVAVIALRLISLSTRNHMKGVADFLSANRSAGRYLLTIAGQMGGTGALSVIAFFQMYYSSGLPPIWWNFMNLPCSLLIVMSGWVYYRYRETRSLTLAQFMEMRYGHNFRVFAGLVMWICGMLNFGIFPAVAARFFIYYCGLPDHFYILHHNIPMIAPIMALDLGFALTFVNMGGQISVMVTECAQGIVTAFAFLVIVGTVLLKLSWGKMVHVLSLAPANASMLHPFHTGAVANYNVWYFLIAAFSTMYCMCAWQGSAGFMVSGRSAHEQKMGQIIAVWRQLPLISMYMILPIAAYSVMRLPEYSRIAAAATATLNTIQNADIKSEMTTPVLLAHFLPIGVKGLLATIMLFFSFTCHDTYMHSWGSIFVQDVLIPIRGRTLSPARHVQWLRWSIMFVAFFAFCFSLFYQPKEDILMFCAITGTIWGGGAGAVIIGGLYWRRGTTPAAYTSIVFSSIIGIGGLLASHWYKNHFGHNFPLNNQWLFFLSMIGSSICYVSVSLLMGKKLLSRFLTAALITALVSIAGRGLLFAHTPILHANPIIRWAALVYAVGIIFVLACLAVCRESEQEFNIDRMLHRGAYSDKASQLVRVSPWQRLLGITSEFTVGDRFLAFALITWQIGWITCFAVVTILNLIYPARFPTAWWASFWHIYIMSIFCLGVPITIWFTVGGILDIKGLFRTLADADRDVQDDGRVVLAEETPSESA